MPSAVCMKNVFKSYDGVPALAGLSFDVPERSIFGLVGRNGAGKTTALRILNTSLLPDSGQCMVAGYDPVRNPKEVRARIGILSEHYARIRPSWEVLEYLRYFCRLAGVDEEERCREALEGVGLFDARYRSLGTLSAGMRKRVEIARLLLKEPSILLLDEPGKELDILGKEEIWLQLLRYAREGATIVLTSHDPTEVATLCNRVCVIRRGKATYDGVPDIPQRSGISIPSSLFEPLTERLNDCPVRLEAIDMGDVTLLSPSEGAGLGVILEWLHTLGIDEKYIRLSNVGGLAQYL